MDLITTEYLDSIPISISENIFFLTKRALIDDGISISQNNLTAFLSHSHSDKMRILPIVKILNSVGVNIYVDWLDNDMPAITSGKTADILKTKIKQNRKFILLASNTAIKSSWVNWELGIGDGLKYIDNMMIFPFKENNQNWTNNEYFEIYPHLQTENKYDYETGNNVTYHVIYPNKSKIKLQDWLKR
ncbi:toll/interleukin-1 receptor domain-containing protein [Flectobacillus rivi]|uniref:TIR domain-containing protein n=1 Tax=Flectobacillus rivi TaxID=2984209 RepID=A0ABT6Z643_9BACT|nr:toll/interleukin-1 receptor domain-containing protein [Flectobacillus rivi]MDI9876597.1 TIR domain-containing protein [Flectobacillus rivi]